MRDSEVSHKLGALPVAGRAAASPVPGKEHLILSACVCMCVHVHVHACNTFLITWFAIWPVHRRTVCHRDTCHRTQAQPNPLLTAHE